MAISISATQANMSMAASSPSVTVPEVSMFMDLIFNQDLENVFFNSSEFAETVSYYHSAIIDWWSYNVIWDEPHASVDLVVDAEFNSRRPQFQISEAELVHRVLKGDKIKRKGKVYFVDDFTSDGVGVTTVYLRIK